MTDQRPDADRLLALLKEEEAQALRGKLKIFFGASAGVGKTYAMLSAAHAHRDLGTGVVIGVVETHGRAETEALLDGLEVLPLKEVSYRDRRLREFDLDAALKRKPALILMSAVPLLQSLVHRFVLPWPWPLGLAAGFGAAAIAFALALACVRGAGIQVGGFLAAATLAQVPAVLAARAIARRLRPGMIDSGP